MTDVSQPDNEPGYGVVDGAKVGIEGGGDAGEPRPSLGES